MSNNDPYIMEENMNLNEWLKKVKAEKLEEDNSLSELAVVPKTYVEILYHLYNLPPLIKETMDIENANYNADIASELNTLYSKSLNLLVQAKKTKALEGMANVIDINLIKSEDIQCFTEMIIKNATSATEYDFEKLFGHVDLNDEYACIFMTKYSFEEYSDPTRVDINNWCKPTLVETLCWQNDRDGFMPYIWENYILVNYDWSYVDFVDYFVADKFSEEMASCGIDDLALDRYYHEGSIIFVLNDGNIDVYRIDRL